MPAGQRCSMRWSIHAPAQISTALPLVPCLWLVQGIAVPLAQPSLRLPTPAHFCLLLPPLAVFLALHRAPAAVAVDLQQGSQAAWHGPW